MDNNRILDIYISSYVMFHACRNLPEPSNIITSVQWVNAYLLFSCTKHTSWGYLSRSCFLVWTMPWWIVIIIAVQITMPFLKINGDERSRLVIIHCVPIHRIHMIEFLFPSCSNTISRWNSAVSYCRKRFCKFCPKGAILFDMNMGWYVISTHQYYH